MTTPVIRVENLSKKFIISHEAPERYTSLRDVIARKAKAMTGKSEKPVIAAKEEFFALRDLSFDIQQGNRIGIIGRNGAGKSTLLKILSRITEPTSGRITIRGRVASLLEVGTGFHPELTGRENIFLNGAILGMSRSEIRRKFDEIVAFAEVEKFLDTPVKRYSSGMYVRLAFAVAAHLEPEILIVDEVLSVGDIQFQRKCLGKMEDVSKNEGRTIVFVSHDLNSVSKLCNTAFLLNKGTCIQAGEVNSVINTYLTLAKRNDYSFVRTGTREVELINILFKNEEGNLIDDLVTGLSVVAEMECEAKKPMRNIQFSICFNNIYNSRVTSWWTAFIGESYDVNPGRFKVFFKLDRLGLIPGDYQLISYINWGEVVIERIDNFRNVSVIPSNFEIERMVPTIAQGTYLAGFSVEIEK